MQINCINKPDIICKNVVNQSIYQIMVAIKVTFKQFKGVLLRLITL